MMTIITYIFKN